VDDGAVRHERERHHRGPRAEPSRRAAGPDSLNDEGSSMSMIKASSGPAPTTAMGILTRPFWYENPVLVQTLGLCSALAVTNAVANSIAMGLATTFVLVGSAIIVSLLRKIIPHQIRITTYILIIATFLAIADMTLEAVVPDVHK